MKLDILLNMHALSEHIDANKTGIAAQTGIAYLQTAKGEVKYNVELSPFPQDNNFPEGINVALAGRPETASGSTEQRLSEMGRALGKSLKDVLVHIGMVPDQPMTASQLLEAAQECLKPEED